MRLPGSLQNVNWPLVLLHALAGSFIVLAARFAAFLLCIDVLEAFITKGVDKSLHEKPDLGSLLLFMNLYIVSTLLAFVVSFTISLVINLRHRQLWINSLIAILLCYVLNFLQINELMMDSLEMFGITNVSLILAGEIVCSLGSAFFLFFGRWSKKYLGESKKVEPVPPEEMNAGPSDKRDVRCPRCYTMNFDRDRSCVVCGKRLPPSK